MSLHQSSDSLGLLRPRRISRLVSNTEPSFMESMSQPGTTSSLKDCFEKVNAGDENHVLKDYDPER